jgi:two-component system chemotaxis sensor kinase CheA
MEAERQALLDLFRAESEEHLALMEEALIALEASPEDPEPLRAVFRVAHTLKGNSNSLGFSGLAECAHALEDLLERARDGGLVVTPSLVGLLLEAADGLRDMVRRRRRQAGRRPRSGSLVARLSERAREASGAHASRPGNRERTPAASASGARARSLRVDVGKLDRLLSLAGEIAVARSQLRRRIEERLDRTGEDLLEAHLLADRLQRDVQEQVMGLRMVPVGPTFRQHARTVRDLAVAQGKRVRLVTQGDDIEVDTSIIEQVRDPLLHLIRNSLDHGIERPDVRQAAGKDPTGTIHLRARHEAGGIVVEIQDDGAGLDRQRILARARERGVPEPERLSVPELHRLVLEAGFSTAGAVTALSGRGIGMDVVRRNVEALGGSVELASEEGRGTMVALRLPLTLALIDGFLVSSAGETYVIPMRAVSECRDHASQDPGLPEAEILDLRGRPLPCLRLRRLFSLPGEPPRREGVVVVEGTFGVVGLIVDALLGESQVVIRQMGAPFRGLPGLAGTTILGSGRVALVLDLSSLARRSTPLSPSPVPEEKESVS